MDKEQAHKQIARAAKTLFAYCRARTDSREEAEDLSQEILLELLRCHGNIRDDNAFYGFLWAVAGNRYKAWCRKKRSPSADAAPLDGDIAEKSEPLWLAMERDEDLCLLRRELSLLEENHRKATVAYYVEGLPVRQIARRLCVSESMVKYLLFHARKQLKEGIAMQRTWGERSYRPGAMNLRYWGDGPNRFWDLCRENRIAQNILLACYNDRCTAQEISLQLGVAVPYLEDDLHRLLESGVLRESGRKYETAVVIFTKEFQTELERRTLPIEEEMAAEIHQWIEENGQAAEQLGDWGGGMNRNLLRWHLASLLLEDAVLDRFQGSLSLEYPVTAYGDHAFIWGEEEYPGEKGQFGTCSLTNGAGDRVCFLDFTLNGDMLHHAFYNYPHRVRLLLALARDTSAETPEGDREELAEFLRLGVVRKEGEALRLCLPVFRRAEWDSLRERMAPAAVRLEGRTRDMARAAAALLRDSAPAYLCRTAEELSWLTMFDTALTGTFKALLDSGYLTPARRTEIPTATIRLAD